MGGYVILPNFFIGAWHLGLPSDIQPGLREDCPQFMAESKTWSLIVSMNPSLQLAQAILQIRQRHKRPVAVQVRGEDNSQPKLTGSV